MQNDDERHFKSIHRDNIYNCNAYWTNKIVINIYEERGLITLSSFIKLQTNFVDVILLPQNRKAIFFSCHGNIRKIKFLYLI